MSLVGRPGRLGKIKDKSEDLPLAIKKLPTGEWVRLIGGLAALADVILL